MSISIKPKIVMPSPTTLTDRQAAQDRLAQRQYARTLSFDRRGSAYRLTMNGGATISIPVSCIDELRELAPSQLAKVTLASGGGALEQRELDIDISLPGLLRDVFGFELQQHRAARARTPTKAAAAKVNGKKGGRPRKAPIA